MSDFYKNDALDYEKLLADALKNRDVVSGEEHAAVTRELAEARAVIGDRNEERDVVSRAEFEKLRGRYEAALQCIASLRGYDITIAELERALVRVTP